MPIQFPTLLQDSWNFMRNQLNFTLAGVGLLILVQLLTFYITPKNMLDPTMLQSEMLDKALVDSLLPSLISSFLGLFINILLVLNIKSINNGLYRHFFEPFSRVLKVIFPVIGLSVLMVIPLSVGLAAGVMSTQSSGLAIVSLPLMITGIFLFVKWCLAVYVYLIEEPQKGVFETLAFTWQMSRGRVGTLFFFCILSYLAPSLFVSLISNLGGELGLILSHIVGAFFNLFVVIFSFRFYQVYRQHKA